MKTRSSRSGKGFGKGRQPQRPRHQTQFQSVQEWDDDFLALFPHRYDCLWAEHPHPGERPDWQTESGHPLTARLIKHGTYLYGVRFKSLTQYMILDPAGGSGTSLHCQECDRFLRNLTQPQAQSFGRHLPKPKQQPPEQLSLLTEGES